MTSSLAEGSLLSGRYRLKRVLGTGGMAAVWRAQDERLRRTVAVKILSEVLLADSVYLTRFRREARLAASLSHPNLVRIYDFGSEGDRPFLAMEYIEGGSLADRISAGTARTLDPKRLARELLQALDNIHRAGIVHRDVKPGNVLIAPDGSAKLTDFGIAQPEDATRLTKTGLVVGTLRYLAPEVERGEPATPRSDLYSCGIVLREVIGESTPGAVAALAANLTVDEPGHRPQSAASALAILDDAAAAPTEPIPTEPMPTEPVEAEATGPTRPLGASAHQERSGHRRRVRVVPGSILVALLLAAVALGAILLAGNGEESATGGPSAEDESAEEARQQESSTSVEESTVPEEEDEVATSSEPSLEEDAVDSSPGSEKPKKPKKPKAPPGKAKGLKK